MEREEGTPRSGCRSGKGVGVVFRLVQVGCGARGRMWDEIVHRLDAAVVGYVDVAPTAARALAEPRHRPAFGDLDQALDQVECDAVLLVTPPAAHRRHVEVAIARRLPILSEKPLAEGLGEAVAMVEAAETAGVPLAVSLQFRYLPVTSAMRRLLAERRYGEPGFGQLTYFRNRHGTAPHLNRYPLTMRHPMLVAQTVHHYDLIRHVYAAEPVWLYADTWNPPWSMYAHDSNVATSMLLDNGMRVEYLGTWTGGWDRLMFEWRTDCAAGVVIQRDLFGDLAVAAIGDADPRPHPLPPFTPFYDDTEALLRAFVAAVQGGSAVPCSGRDHLRTLAMVFAAMDASETGCRIDMEAFRRRHRV